MSKVYSEEDIAWSSIEKYVPYDKVVWSVRRNGIPVYSFIGENGDKISIKDYVSFM